MTQRCTGEWQTWWQWICCSSSSNDCSKLIAHWACAVCECTSDRAMPFIVMSGGYLTLPCNDIAMRCWEKLWLCCVCIILVLWLWHCHVMKLSRTNNNCSVTKLSRLMLAQQTVNVIVRACTLGSTDPHNSECMMDFPPGTPPVNGLCAFMLG